MTTTTRLTASQVFAGIEGVERGGESRPFCQILNPENVRVLTEEICKEKDYHYGLFIPEDSALKAGFQPDSKWRFVTHYFGREEGEPEPIKGYLTTLIRLVCVQRSAVEIEVKGDYGWEYIGDAFKYGKPTELYEQTKGVKGYRIRTRYLVAFLNENNQLLQETPFILSLGAGTGAAVSSELVALEKEIQDNFARSQEKFKDGKRLIDLPMDKLCLIILEAQLGFHRNGQNAPFTAPKVRYAPVNSEDWVGKEKAYSFTGGREVLRVGKHLSELFIAVNSPEANKIQEWFEQYKDFSNRSVYGGSNSEETTDTHGQSNTAEEAASQTLEEDVDFDKIPY